MDYAEAIMKFTDDIDGVCGVGEDNGLSNKEMADELRRIAQQIEDAA